MIHNIYSSIKINLTRTRNLKHLGMMYISYLYPRTCRPHIEAAREEGRVRIHVLVVPSCWPWSWGSEASSSLATSSSISSSLFTTNRHMSPPGGGGDAAAIGQRGATRMASGLGGVTKSVSSRLIQSGCRNAVGSGEVGTQYIGNQLLSYTHRSSRACPWTSRLPFNMPCLHTQYYSCHQLIQRGE